MGNLPEVLREGQETATARWCKEYGPGPFVYWLGAVPIVTSDNPQFAKWGEGVGRAEGTVAMLGSQNNLPACSCDAWFSAAKRQCITISPLLLRSDF